MPIFSTRTERVHRQRCSRERTGQGRGKRLFAQLRSCVLRSCVRRCWLAIVLLMIPCGDRSDGADELSRVDWAEFSYPLELTDGQLGGPGAEWISRQASGCQFVLFGEQHGVAGLPDLVSAVYTQLQPEGFNHLIMERGPWVARRLSRDGVDITIQQIPFSVAFDYDGEVRLLKNAEARFDGSGDVFWGVDQSLTAIHALDHLAKILPTHASRNAARGLFLRDALQGGRFLVNDNASDLEALRRLAGPNISDEAELMLDALETSQSIFVAYHKKMRDERGVGVSDIIREQYMIDQFDQYLAESDRLGQLTPKGIVKMGGAHVMEGIGTNGVRTLGDHIQQVAESNGKDALHITIRGHSSESDWPAQVFADSRMVLIDSRALRDLVARWPKDEVSASLSRDVSQYDAVLLIRDAESDTSAVIQRHETAFRRSMLSRLAIVLLPTLVLISLTVPFCQMLYQSIRRRKGVEPRLPWVAIGVLASVLMTVIIVQVLRIRRREFPELSQLTNAAWMSLLEVVCVVVPLVLCVLMVRRSWWSKSRRIHFGLLSVGLVGLATFSHWWNLGRMWGN